MLKKKMILPGPYRPSHALNRMCSEGDTAKARGKFFQNRFRNLDHLFRSRFSWMNRYLKEGMKIIEIGSGAGFSELYLKIRPIMTDVVMNPWIGFVLDATKMDLNDNSFDCLIAMNNVHHFSSPYQFFKECERVLVPGGDPLDSRNQHVVGHENHLAGDEARRMVLRCGCL